MSAKERAKVPKGFKPAEKTLRFNATEMAVYHNYWGLADHGTMDERLSKRIGPQRISGKWELFSDSLKPTTAPQGERPEPIACWISFYPASAEERDRRWQQWQDEEKTGYLAKHGVTDASQIARSLQVDHEGYHTVALLYNAVHPDFDHPASWDITCTLPAKLWSYLYSEVIANRVSAMSFAIDFDELLVPDDYFMSTTHYCGDTFYVAPDNAGRAGGWLDDISWGNRIVPPAKEAKDEHTSTVSEVSETAQLKQSLQSELQALRAVIERSLWWVIAAIAVAAYFISHKS